MELGKTKEAIAEYKKASSDEDDVFLSPLYLERLGLAYEMSGDKAQAVEAFKLIKMKYAASAQAR